MPPLLSIASLRRPRGLAARAMLFTTGLVVIAALVSAAAFLFGGGPARLFLILACLIPASAWLTARVVSRALASMDRLTGFVERVSEQGHAATPIEIGGGDEFAALAAALNNTMTRLNRSIRDLRDIAFVDAATQLPNHDRFAREIDCAIAKPGGEGQNSAVLVFELQRLRKLMQALDFGAERDFLRVVSERFASAVRAANSSGGAMGARLSAAELAVFALGLGAPAEAVRFAHHINTALNQPFQWRGHTLSLGACCGVALAPRDGRDAAALIRRARLALDGAEIAPGRLKLFTQGLDRAAAARLTLEREMRVALDNNEFRAYFQSKINLASGRIGACEALARWARPDRTIVSPGRFIPVAEESGLIGPLSDAIMREACWKAAAWARAGHPANVAVNVSALQFRGDRFAEHVLAIVGNAGLAPRLLELEITESVVMEDPDRALRVIGPLREAGVRLAIDDFGCGHSNLAALSKLPFDVIKIDQQFVRALQYGESQAPAIIDMILALSRTLEMEVVAEGIERAEEAAFMAGRGCQWAQGFLYGAAVSAAEFAELLRAQAVADAQAA